MGRGWGSFRHPSRDHGTRRTTGESNYGSLVWEPERECSSGVRERWQGLRVLKCHKAGNLLLLYTIKCFVNKLTIRTIALGADLCPYCIAGPRSMHVTTFIDVDNTLFSVKLTTMPKSDWTWGTPTY